MHLWRAQVNGSRSIAEKMDSGVLRRKKNGENQICLRLMKHEVK